MGEASRTPSGPLMESLTSRGTAAETWSGHGQPPALYNNKPQVVTLDMRIGTT